MNWQILRARWSRWAYLITEGMWRGECAVDIWNERTG